MYAPAANEVATNTSQKIEVDDQEEFLFQKSGKNDDNATANNTNTYLICLNITVTEQVSVISHNKDEQ